MVELGEYMDQSETPTDSGSMQVRGRLDHIEMRVWCMKIKQRHTGMDAWGCGGEISR